MIKNAFIQKSYSKWKRNDTNKKLVFKIETIFKTEKKLNSDFQPERVQTDMLSISSIESSKNSSKKSNSLDLKRNKRNEYDVVMPYQKYI